MYALRREAFMADPDILASSLVGPVLYQCPLLSQQDEILPLVTLTVLGLVESFRPHSPGGHNDMCMGIVS